MHQTRNNIIWDDDTYDYPLLQQQTRWLFTTAPPPIPTPDDNINWRIERMTRFVNHTTTTTRNIPQPSRADKIKARIHGCAGDAADPDFAELAALSQ